MENGRKQDRSQVQVETPNAPLVTEPANATAAPRTGEGTREASRALPATNVTAGNGNSAPHPIPGRDGIPVNAIVHGACGQWWTGLSRAHCPACHHTFSSDSAANKHRVGKHGVDRRCVDPATVGLVATEKPYGLLWSHPAPEGGYAALHTPAALCPVAAENTQKETTR